MVSVRLQYVIACCWHDNERFQAEAENVSVRATTNIIRRFCDNTVKTYHLLDSKWLHQFLANVNSCSRSLYAVARPSVVCLSVGNARAPYSGGCNFPQFFYGLRYLGHPLTSTENFTEIVPGEPLRRGVKHKSGSQI